MYILVKGNLVTFRAEIGLRYKKDKLIIYDN